MMMMTGQTLLEGGPAQPFAGTAADLDELRLRSTELATRLGLAEEPFVIDDAAGTIQVRGVAGFVSLGDSTIEIMPVTKWGNRRRDRGRCARGSADWSP